MKYEIKISEQDYAVIFTALQELPYKFSAPLINKLNKQVSEQISNNSNCAEQAKEGKNG